MEKAKATRDKHYNCFKCTFTVACILLILMELILVGSGAYFVGLDIFKFEDKNGSESGIKQLRKPIIAAIVFFFLLANFLAGSGIYFAWYPPGHNIWAALYGFGVFFFGFLPFIVEGGVLLGLSKVPQSEIDKLCEDKELHLKSGGKYKLLNEIMTFAHNFDT